MNVHHRWRRILESSEPRKYDKILQIHTLQKQLVEMSENKVIQIDLLIQEKEKVYIELKNVICSTARTGDRRTGAALSTDAQRETATGRGDESGARDVYRADEAFQRGDCGF